MSMQEQLSAIHEVAESSVGLVLDQIPASEWQPAPGSLGHEDLENAELGRSRKPWGPLPVQTSQSYVVMIAMSAIDHLGAIVTCTQPALASCFAPWSLARAVVEQASLAWWAIDPDITVRERVERGAAIRVRGLRDRFKALEYIGDENGAMELSDHIGRVLHDAWRLGLPVIKKDKRPVGLKRGLPGKVDRSAAILDRAGVHDSRGIYQYLSSLAHGEGFLVERMSVEVAASESQPGYLAPRLTLPEAAFVIGLSSLAVLELAARLIPHLGFDRGGIHDLQTKAGQLARREVPS
jgi:hypothetical protein